MKLCKFCIRTNKIQEHLNMPLDYEAREGFPGLSSFLLRKRLMELNVEKSEDIFSKSLCALYSDNSLSAKAVAKYPPGLPIAFC